MITPEPVDFKLEVIVISVSDVDNAKAFYEKLGWRLDADFVNGESFRVVQVTPTNSPTSIIFGKGVTSAKPGFANSLVLAVQDIEAARKELVTRGVDASEIFHFAGGPFNYAITNPRVAGRDPEGRSYQSFVSFEDPDGNQWLLQEIGTRLPGRKWKVARNTAALAQLLRETEEHHGTYEKTHGKHDWANWYAPYLEARENGGSPEQATAAANRSMEGMKP